MMVIRGIGASVLRAAPEITRETTFALERRSLLNPISPADLELHPPTGSRFFRMAL
jgi:hypothetical protein